MLISRQWIESMLAEGPVLSDEAFADAITSLGLEVEGITRHGDGLVDVVVARVDKIAPHPNADKLRLVDIFEGERSITVVCGAPNVPEPGGKVAFARSGAVLPGDFVIGARKIRGVQSEGMLCGEDELGLGNDTSGIMILPESWEPGTPLPDLVPGIRDTIFELGITPNRPDALGHVGVARDLGVKLKRVYQPDGAAAPAPKLGAIVEGIKQRLEGAPLSGPEDLVTLEAPARCGRYIGRTFEGATVGPSPLWLSVRLHRLALRSINNVVDITNYVLMMWGQPLHVFDRSKLAGGRVVVRHANAGEPMTTLDDAKLELNADDLVIADAEVPAALAGVMGGADSGVEAGAQTLLLEAAWFAPAGVRTSARRHQLSTDSSYRFERGVDYGARLTTAAATAESLLVQLAGARCTGGVDVAGEAPERASIVLRHARVERVLGMAIPTEEARRVLTGLEVQIDGSDSDAAWTCVAPTHRPDLVREEDLIEELMRHYGLDRLPDTPSVPTEPPGLRVTDGQRQTDELARLEDGLLDAMRAEGLHEALSFAFCDPSELKLFGDWQHVHVSNPLRSQLSVMRTHMLPGLLGALRNNLAKHGRAVMLCEMGRVYSWSFPLKDALRGAQGRAPLARPGGASATAEVDAQLPRERRRACFLVCGGTRNAASFDGTSEARRVLSVLSRVGVPAAVRPADPAESWLHPGVQAAVSVGGEQVGVVGEVHPDVLTQFEIPEGVRVHYAEIWVDALGQGEVARYAALPSFPATSRDLSLEIPTSVPAAVAIDALVAAEAGAEHAPDGPRLRPGDTGADAVEVVDDYRGQGVPQGHRALLLRLHYRAAERSVTDEEVQALHDVVLATALQTLTSVAPDVRAR